MGSANQALSDLAGETLSISNVEIFSAPGSDAGPLEEMLGPGPFYDLPLETVQETLSTLIHLLIPDLLVQQVKRKLGLGEPQPPPPAAGPGSAARGPRRRPRPPRHGARPGPAWPPPSRCAPPPRWTPATSTSSWTSNCP